MAEPRQSPYVWVTWLTKLLVGEDSCEWASWFKAQHEGWSWDKVPSTFDLAKWTMDHTALLGRVRAELEGNGYAVFEESQNQFTLRISHRISGDSTRRSRKEISAELWAGIEQTF